MDKTTTPKRVRVEPIKVCCTSTEREVILAGAEGVGLTASAYLRRLGLGYRPPSIVELEAVDTMLTISADAGRLGGLLKMFLADDQRLKKFAPTDMRPVIQKALVKIGEAQTELRAVAETVLKARA